MKFLQIEWSWRWAAMTSLSLWLVTNSALTLGQIWSGLQCFDGPLITGHFELWQGLDIDEWWAIK